MLNLVFRRFGRDGWDFVVELELHLTESELAEFDLKKVGWIETGTPLLRLEGMPIVTWYYRLG